MMFSRSEDEALVMQWGQRPRSGGLTVQRLWKFWRGKKVTHSTSTFIVEGTEREACYP